MDQVGSDGRWRLFVRPPARLRGHRLRGRTVPEGGRRFPYVGRPAQWRRQDHRRLRRSPRRRHQIRHSVATPSRSFSQLFAHAA